MFFVGNTLSGLILFNVLLTFPLMLKWRSVDARYSKNATSFLEPISPIASKMAILIS